MPGRSDDERLPDLDAEHHVAAQGPDSLGSRVEHPNGHPANVAEQPQPGVRAGPVALALERRLDGQAVVDEDLVAPCDPLQLLVELVVDAPRRAGASRLRAWRREARGR